MKSLPSLAGFSFISHSKNKLQIDNFAKKPQAIRTNLKRQTNICPAYFLIYQSIKPQFYITQFKLMGSVEIEHFQGDLNRDTDFARHKNAICIFSDL